MRGSNIRALHRWSTLIEAAAIQGLGSLAILLCTVLLARSGGATLQGSFSSVKAEIDFLSALFLFGLPQALFYYLHTSGLSQRTFFWVIVGQTLLATVGGGAYWLVASGEKSRTLVSAVLIAFAVGLSVAYGALRGAVLACRSARLFSLISAAPNVLILVTAATAAVLRQFHGDLVLRMLQLFGLAYLVSAAIAVLAIAGVSLSISGGNAVSARRLYEYGAATWISPVLQSTVVLVVVKHIGAMPTGTALVGVFSAALLLINLVLTPLNLAAPVLFKQWTEVTQKARVKEMWIIAMSMAAGTLTLAAILVAFGKPLLTAVFGIEYASRHDVFALMCLSILPLGMLKLWGLMFSAAGRPYVPVWIDAVRAVAVIGGVLLAAKSLESAVRAWVFADFLVMAVALLLLRAAMAPNTERK